MGAGNRCRALPHASGEAHMLQRWDESELECPYIPPPAENSMGMSRAVV